MKITSKTTKGVRKTLSTSRRLSQVQNEALMNSLMGMSIVTKVTKKPRKKQSPRRLECSFALSK